MFRVFRTYVCRSTRPYSDINQVVGLSVVRDGRGTGFLEATPGPQIDDALTTERFIIAVADAQGGSSGEILKLC